MAQEEDHPPPWIFKGKTYTFLFYAMDPKPVVAAGGMDEAAATSFKGGQGGFMLNKWADTPVGPYTHILYCPGVFEQPKGLKLSAAYPISRGYVSTEAALRDTRRNFAFPYKVADIDWKEDAATNTTHVTVTEPGNPSAIILKITVQHNNFLSIPMSTALAPAMPMVHKVIPGETVEFDDKGAVKARFEAEDPKTEATYCTTTFSSNFWCKLASVAVSETPDVGKYVDVNKLPAMARSGIYVENYELHMASPRFETL